ncbi:hypothetical protein BUE80_DR012839 [Diplocarpon rosae]|nr:hypothetical protein BUE80_DR012839 [Diplocarpon rosae]
MDTNIEDTVVGNETMGSEEAAMMHNLTDAKPVYKSFKKKYRKMKVKFDEVMRESNDLYVEEQRANSTVKRLAQENDQILDLLLEMNNSGQLPIDKRINITSGLPELAPLFTEEDLASAAQLQTPEGTILYREICALLKERDATNSASKPLKSLATLLKTIPHPDLQTPGKADEIEQTRAPLGGQTALIGYLTADQIDEYLDEVDAQDGVRKKRAYNRKPKLADGETPPVSAKKGKGRAKPKAPSPDPTAHPFGPPRT